MITSGLSLLALVRLLSTTVTQRIERARDNVADEAAYLASARGDERQARLHLPPRSQTLGMHGGYVEASGPEHGNAPATWQPTVARAIREAAQTRRPVLIDASLGDGRVVVGAQPSGDGFAWAAYALRTPPYMDNWRWIVLALSMVTLLLVGFAVHAVVTIKRSASDLNTALVALASDLSTPVPRPPVRELNDIAEGIAALANNLAQSREAQERLGRELARQERLAALGRVVAGVAHEVRNPLASIKLRLDLATSGGPALPAPVEQAVSHASAEIARLDRLVADLLVVAGRSLGPQRRASLGDLLRARAEALAPWAQLRRVAIDISGDASAQIDPDSIARACDNLLRNAIEASPPDGRVAVNLIADGHEAKIQIDDRGEGVPAPRATMLFEPFFTTKADGTGLGLAISRALARAHGGDVVYQRTDGVTRFELTLPLSAAAPEVRHAS